MRQDHAAAEDGHRHPILPVQLLQLHLGRPLCAPIPAPSTHPQQQLLAILPLSVMAGQTDRQQDSTDDTARELSVSNFGKHVLSMHARMFLTRRRSRHWLGTLWQGLCPEVSSWTVSLDAQRASNAHAADKGQRLASVADRQLHHLQRRRTYGKVSHIRHIGCRTT